MIILWRCNFRTGGLAYDSRKDKEDIEENWSNIKESTGENKAMSR